MKFSNPTNSVWKCSIEMNFWVPLCSAGFPRRESDHWRLNKIYTRLWCFQGVSMWKCFGSSTSAPQPWETVVAAASKHRWATAAPLLTQVTSSSLSTHFSKSPGKHQKNPHKPWNSTPFLQSHHCSAEQQPAWIRAGLCKVVVNTNAIASVLCARAVYSQLKSVIRKGKRNLTVSSFVYCSAKIAFPDSRGCGDGSLGSPKGTDLLCLLLNWFCAWLCYAKSFPCILHKFHSAFSVPTDSADSATAKKETRSGQSISKLGDTGPRAQLPFSSIASWRPAEAWNRLETHR